MSLLHSTKKTFENGGKGECNECGTFNTIPLFYVFDEWRYETGENYE